MASAEADRTESSNESERERRREKENRMFKYTKIRIEQKRIMARTANAVNRKRGKNAIRKKMRQKSEFDLIIIIMAMH